MALTSWDARRKLLASVHHLHRSALPNSWPGAIPLLPKHRPPGVRDGRWVMNTPSAPILLPVPFFHLKGRSLLLPRAFPCILSAHCLAGECSLSGGRALSLLKSQATQRQEPFLEPLYVLTRMTVECCAHHRRKKCLTGSSLVA